MLHFSHTSILANFFAKLISEPGRRVAYIGVIPHPLIEALIQSLTCTCTTPLPLCLCSAHLWYSYAYHTKLYQAHTYFSPLVYQVVPSRGAICVVVARGTVCFVDFAVDISGNRLWNMRARGMCREDSGRNLRSRGTVRRSYGRPDAASSSVQRSCCKIQIALRANFLVVEQVDSD